MISNEVAIEAERKGFTPYGHRKWHTKLLYPKTGSIFGLGRTGKIKMENLVYIPCELELCHWLRSEYRINISILYLENKWKYNIQFMMNNSIICSDNSILFNSYLECLNKAFLIALDHVNKPEPQVLEFDDFDR